MGQSIGNVYGVFGLKYKNFSKGLKNIERSLKKNAKQMKSIGSSITKNFTAPLLAASAASFKFSKDFNESMSNVSTLIPDNTKRILELKSGVQDLAIQSGESTGELSQGLYNVVSAFGDTENSMKTLELVSKSAKSGLGSFDDALSLISATTKGYGDTSLYAQNRVGDLAQMTIKLGQTNLSDLGVSIQEVTAQSSKLGITQEEMFASFSATTGVIGNASSVSTKMKASLQALANPTKELTKLYEKLGVENGKQLVEQYGFQGALKEIAKEADKSKIPLQKLVSSSEAVAFTLSLTGAQSKKYQSDLVGMIDSTGTLTKAYEQKTQGINKLGFQYNQLVQVLAVTAQTMGDSLAPALSRVKGYLDPTLEKLKLGAEYFNKLDEETKNTVFDIALLVSGLGLGLTALGSFATMGAIVTSGLGSLITGLVGASKALILTKTSLFSLQSGFAGVIALIAGWNIGTYLNENYVEVRQFGINLVQNFKKLWEYVSYSAESAFSAIPFALEASLKKMNDTLFIAIRETARGLMKYGGDVGESMAAPLRKWGLKFQESLKQDEDNLKVSHKIKEEEHKKHLARLQEIDATTIDLFQDALIPKKKTKPKLNNLPTNSPITGMDGAIDSLTKLADGLKNKVTDATNTKPVKDLNEEIKNIGKEIDSSGSKTKKFGTKTKSVFSDLTDASKDWASNMASSFTDMARRGDLSFKSIGKSFQDSVLSKLFQVGMNSLTTMIGIPGFADGGYAQGLAMVGERGPELVDFGSSGAYVKTANQTREILNGSGGSGSSVNINMTNVFNDNVSAAVQQEILKATPVLKSKIIAGVAEAFDRRELSFS